MTRYQTKVETAVSIIAIAAVIGASYAAFLDIVIRSDLSASTFLRGAIRGFVISAIVLAFEFSFGESRYGKTLRRAPFLQSLGVRTLATTLILLVAIIASRLLLGSDKFPLSQWINVGLPRDFVFAVIVAFLIHFVLQTRRLIGGKELTYFLLGRYNNPVAEERIFLLLDIVGSTTIAHRLGDTKALELICRFFFDIAEPIVRHDGNTHIYVGDEVVVSWPMLSKKQNARCLQCYVAIVAMLAQKQKDYIRDYGQALDIRVGIHGGAVVSGECGDDKRQIVYIGDTINLAKRLQETCRDYDRRVIVSGELLNRLEMPTGILREDLGSKVLRGRDIETHLYSLSAADTATT